MVVSSSIGKKAGACFLSKFSDFCIIFPKKLKKVALKVKVVYWDGLLMEA